MKNKISLSALPIMLILAGCTPRSYEADPQFGQAIREYRVMQTVNPEGMPVLHSSGLDGEPSKAVIERYVKSFQAPPPQVNVLSIGVGAGGSGGQSPSASTAQ